MDILELIDRLEDLFNESHSVPFTHSVIVDEDRMLDIIDQMRVSIPDEIKKAEQIINQKERFLAQAQEDAARITNIARERSVKAVRNEDVFKEANETAQQLISSAEEEKRTIKKETNDYIVSSLEEFENQLLLLVKQVQNGIATVKTQTEE